MRVVDSIVIFILSYYKPKGESPDGKRESIHRRARAILRMPALHLANMQSVAQDRNQVQSINEAPKQRHTRKRRKLSKEAREKLAASTRKRWDVVRAAGIKMKGTVPTAAEVERGRKILERRKTKTTKAKPVRAKGRKAAEPTAAAA
jgi:hypothetical protein